MVSLFHSAVALPVSWLRDKFRYTSEEVIQELENWWSRTEGGDEPLAFSEMYKQELREKLERATKEFRDEISDELYSIKLSIEGETRKNLFALAVQKSCPKLVELLTMKHSPYLLLLYLPDGGEKRLSEALAAKLLAGESVVIEGRPTRRGRVADVLVESISNRKVKQLRPPEWSAIIRRAKALPGGSKGAKCCNEALAQFLAAYPECMEKVAEAVKNILRPRNKPSPLVIQKIG